MRVQSGRLSVHIAWANALLHNEPIFGIMSLVFTFVAADLVAMFDNLMSQIMECLEVVNFWSDLLLLLHPLGMFPLHGNAMETL